MSASPPHDPLLQALASLPRLEPDDPRAEAVRQRCRERLNHRRRTVTHVEIGSALESAALGATCGVYGWQLARLAALLLK